MRISRVRTLFIFQTWFTHKTKKRIASTNRYSSIDSKIKKCFIFLVVAHQWNMQISPRDMLVHERIMNSILFTLLIPFRYFHNPQIIILHIPINRKCLDSMKNHSSHYSKCSSHIIIESIQINLSGSSTVSINIEWEYRRIFQIYRRINCFCFSHIFFLHHFIGNNSFIYCYIHFSFVPLPSIGRFIY